MKICNQAGVDYADIRIVEMSDEVLKVRNGLLSEIVNSKNLGYGIRVIAGGAWGFASSANLHSQEITNTVRRAIQIANASAMKINKRVKLAAEPIWIDRWATPYIIDPFKVSYDEKLQLLYSTEEILRNNDPRVKSAWAYLSIAKEHQWFASSEGSRIEQEIVRSGAEIGVSVSDGNEIQRRTFPASSGQYLQGGYEVILGLKLKENAAKTRDEALSLLTAPPCPSGERELIILGSQLALQIHESIGHATELDRVLGLEANYAGRSFVDLEKKGRFQYGSRYLNIIADSTMPQGLATYGYDDDGVRPERYHVIKEGVFQTYLTNRELAHNIGETRSRGCNRAEGWQNIPIIRMPNLSLAAGDATLAELIADTKDGIMVDGIKCWSIDQYRYNFQFGMEIGWHIQNGKIVGPVKDPCYQGITPEFWGRLVGVADEEHWHLWGVPNCGKGQPGQRAEMSHGTAPSKFSKVSIGYKQA
ncbi:MAG: TldD/PmbA family protein [Oligoflexia bacterium]|nr:TldD/PmbA family protein [Oligoflexia bacterium]MBF0364668.1 TldD/PmbA family protein [Oligoflexia bacterium]